MRLPDRGHALVLLLAARAHEIDVMQSITIGARAVVTKSVPVMAIVAGVLARIMGTR
jgi:serine acetyltransferase